MGKKKLGLGEEEPEYEMDQAIDPGALDVEWLEQASLFMRWSEKSADASARVDRAKDKLKVVKAEVFLDVRAHPEKYRLEKVTDKVTEAVVESSEEVQAAASELITFKHESDILSAAVKSFEQRKTALENLVKLQGQNYFAGPTEPRDLRGEFDSHQAAEKVARERIQKRRDLRRKK